MKMISARPINDGVCPSAIPLASIRTNNMRNQLLHIFYGVKHSLSVASRAYPKSRYSLPQLIAIVSPLYEIPSLAVSDVVLDSQTSTEDQKRKI